MKRKHQKTLEQIYTRPTSGNIPWRDIESLFKALGADVSESAGSRIAVVLFNEVRVFHRPHPSPNTDKGAIASIRKWLELYEVKPWVWWKSMVTRQRLSTILSLINFEASHNSLVGWLVWDLYFNSFSFVLLVKSQVLRFWCHGSRDILNYLLF